jgi:hypothetical protein
MLSEVGNHIVAYAIQQNASPKQFFAVICKACYRNGRREGGKKETCSKLAPMVGQPAVAGLMSVVVARVEPCIIHKN